MTAERSGSDKAAARRARQADALRANLRRRKQQAKSMAQKGGGSGGGGGTPTAQHEAPPRPVRDEDDRSDW